MEPWRVSETAEGPSRLPFCIKHRASSAIFFQKAGEDWTDVWLRVLSAVERTPLGVVVGRVCHVVGRIVDLAEPQERP